MIISIKDVWHIIYSRLVIRALSSNVMNSKTVYGWSRYHDAIAERYPYRMDSGIPDTAELMNLPCGPRPSNSPMDYRIWTYPWGPERKLILLHLSKASPLTGKEHLIDLFMHEWYIKLTMDDTFVSNFSRQFHLFLKFSRKLARSSFSYFEVTELESWAMVS